jgi:hypothetical protein
MSCDDTSQNCFSPPCNPILNCPHCDMNIIIVEVNCGVFRCGISKFTFTQIQQHLSQDECEKLVKDDIIYGCGKPFMYHNGKLIKCCYI